MDPAWACQLEIFGATPVQLLLPLCQVRPNMHRMRAGILAVGTELLGTDRLDTNSLLLTGALQRFGVEVVRKSVVRDIEVDIAAALIRMIAELDLVLVTGGLGPTSDDLTREATSRALNLPLVQNAELLADLQARFEKWGQIMPPSNVSQAAVISGAEVLANRRGTAPGMRLEDDECTLFLFPGVPSELEGLIGSSLEPWLESRAGQRQIETRVLRIACVSESALEDKLAPAYAEFDRHNISVLSSPGDIQVHLSATGDPEERQELLDAMAQRIGVLVGDALYATGQKASLEGRVAELLMASGTTVSTAESCTAGLMAERLTRIAGSSDYFVGGVVVYSNRLKERLLGVSPSSLERYGAVSREVVLEMAAGAVEQLGSDLGIAISGVAGPGGGTQEKPVGTIHVAITGNESEAIHRELHLPGGRRRVRWLASQWALDLLRRRLQSVGVR